MALDVFYTASLEVLSFLVLSFGFFRRLIPSEVVSISYFRHDPWYSSSNESTGAAGVKSRQLNRAFYATELAVNSMRLPTSDPSNLTRYSPSDWLEISILESTPSSESCSIRAPQVSNSSIYDVSEVTSAFLRKS
ncbi:hypothetical protein V6N13_061531 [Hibiscus sabdariffa]